MICLDMVNEHFNHWLFGWTIWLWTFQPRTFQQRRFQLCFPLIVKMTYLKWKTIIWHYFNATFNIQFLRIINVFLIFFKRQIKWFKIHYLKKKKTLFVSGSKMVSNFYSSPCCCQFCLSTILISFHCHFIKIISHV